MQADFSKEYKELRVKHQINISDAGILDSAITEIKLSPEKMSLSCQMALFEALATNTTLEKLEIYPPRDSVFTSSSPSSNGYN